MGRFSGCVRLGDVDLPQDEPVLRACEAYPSQAVHFLNFSTVDRADLASRDDKARRFSGPHHRGRHAPDAHTLLRAVALKAGCQSFQKRLANPSGLPKRAWRISLALPLIAPGVKKFPNGCARNGDEVMMTARMRAGIRMGTFRPLVTPKVEAHCATLFQYQSRARSP